MTWWHDYGEEHKKLIAAHEAKGLPVPSTLLPPDLPGELQEVWWAFTELSHGRRHSQLGMQGLAAWEIGAWLTERGIFDFESRRWFLDLIHAMDVHWMQLVNAKVREARARKAKKAT